ncbi:hypothetical protein GCM10010324_28980 [Streptomyces hiroshimensis]|uniref:Uncharacterized protein n=1 Tax=Streptomyces hiroshimensis TaxID=66424 RepID=A0ABQ2YGQ6_9ACTN|nr:hypothetical protein GCM10010324_28980 [Streptomyces hiroshimensis]
MVTAAPAAILLRAGRTYGHRRSNERTADLFSDGLECSAVSVIRTETTVHH